MPMLTLMSVRACSVIAGIQRVLVGVAFAVLFSVMNQHYPISYLATQDFAVSAVSQYMYVARMRVYNPWH